MATDEMTHLKQQKLISLFASFYYVHGSWGDEINFWAQFTTAETNGINRWTSIDTMKSSVMVTGQILQTWPWSTELTIGSAAGSWLASRAMSLSK